MKISTLRVLASTALVTSLALPGVAALAQDQERDVIVVTAQKRESTLQDTPVAVTAISADVLEDSQIRDVRDLELLAPSLDVSQFANSSASQFSIRGIGTSPFNAGLEPSVGVFVDGVYRSRQGASINDFPVVERIEILRGPQSTLYGKNTPAGVISILTRLPDDQFGFDAEATLGNFNSQIYRGTVTGPIGQNAAFRISGNYNSRDGFIDNLFDGSDVNNRDRYGVRGQLLFEPASNFSVRIIGDYGSIEEACCAAPFFFNNPVNVGALGLLGATILPATPFERDVRFDGNLLTDQSSGGLSLHADWDFDWGGSFSSITAYRDFDELNDIDADFVDISLSAINQNREEYQTFTQEFRLQSNDGGDLDWMLGYYYFDQDFEHDRISTFGPSLRAFADLVSTSPTAPTGAVSALEGILGLTRGVLPGTFLAAGGGLQSELFNQSTQSHSVFGQVDAFVTDRFTVTAGLRLTDEEKDVTSNVVIDDPFSELDLNNIPDLALLPPPPFGPGPLPVNTFAGLSPFQFFLPFTNFTESRSESNWSGNVILSYDWNDYFNTYASYSRGYKAGGFNLSVGSRASSRDFDAEEMDSFEAGVKAQFMDGALRVNAALFNQVLSDFQANIFNGGAFDLINAGELEVNGLELESTFLPHPDLFFTFGFTHLDAIFNDYQNAPCIISDPLGGDPLGITGCRFDGTRDRSGSDNTNIPDWSATASGTYSHDFGAFGGYVRGELAYRSESNLGGDLVDPNKVQDAYTIFNASVGVNSPSDAWELVLWGRNLSDEEYPQGIFNSVAQPGSYNGYPNDPATYGVTLRLRH